LRDDARVAWAVRRVRAGAEPATRVPADVARHRLGELEETGLTRSAIARRAGVSASVVSRLANPTTLRVSRITAAAVLSLPL
jgi:hypothetical protein